jgi:AcrR family transcriptional regulator
MDALALARDRFLHHQRIDLRRLAQDLGVGRTTLYRWFGDRERLLGEVLGDLNEIAWRATRAEFPEPGMAGLLRAVDRFAVLTSSFEPALHFARTEPAMAMRVLMNPEGRVRSDMVRRIAEEFAENAEPGSYPPETPDVLVELSIALIWTPITIDREPDLPRLRRLLVVLSPPAREVAVA